MRSNKRTFPSAEIIPASYLAPISFKEVFARNAPVDVDLGCGDGSFLTALAEQHAARNFVGVERLVSRVRSASRKIGVRGLPNARILRSDILHAVQHHFAPKSVDVFYLLFPDPWPKRRHHPRRTFNEAFLRAVARALTREGKLHVATDDADYFAAMQAIAADAAHRFRREDDPVAETATTTFEARFVSRGLTIHRLTLRKI